MEIILVIFIIIFLFQNISKNRDKRNTWKTSQLAGISSKTETANIDFQSAYQARYLLTKNEWYQYKKLKTIADEKGLIICPKVRLLDIIEPKHGEKKYKTLFYKIQSKHVDFLICDQDLHIKAILELDDNSHNDLERKERDEFVNLILQSVGYKVIHTRYINEGILDTI